MDNKSTEWLMEKIAEEIINGRLDIPATKQNIANLAKLLSEFESKALASAEQVAFNTKKSSPYWFTSSYQQSQNTTGYAVRL